jgi:hypothetical protein
MGLINECERLIVLRGQWVDVFQSRFLQIG